MNGSKVGQEASIGEREGLWLRRVQAPDLLQSLATQADKKFLRFTILGSLVLHLVLIGLYAFNIHPTEVAKRLERIQSEELITQPVKVYTAEQLDAVMKAKDARPIVDSARVQKSLPVSGQAAFRGEVTQRVARETRASQFGNRQSQAENIGSDLKASGAARSATETKKITLSQLGLGRGELLVQDLKVAANRGDDGAEKKGLKVARGSHDYLGRPVAVGAETLLNTDEFKYSSFFNRLKDAIAPRWEPVVREILEDSSKKIPRGFFGTETVFTMNAAGGIVDVKVSKSSGLHALDAAALTAIRKLEKMENPPLDLRDADGLYRISFGFMVDHRVSGIRADYVPDPRLLNPPNAR